MFILYNRSILHQELSENLALVIKQPQQSKIILHKIYYMKKHLGGFHYRLENHHQFLLIDMEVSDGVAVLNFKFLL